VNSFDPGEGSVLGSCGQGNEHSGSIKDGKFLDYFTDDSIPWS
jgi:hypothetical protein